MSSEIVSTEQRRVLMRTAVFFVAIVIAATTVRAVFLNESLWYDEIWYTFAVLGKESKTVILEDVHPPLYSLFMRGWIEVFGDSEVSVRLPSLIFGLLSLLVIYRLAKNCFGDRVGKMALVLAAFSPVHIWASHETKNNILLLLLTVLAVYFLQRAWHSDRTKDWLYYVAAMIAALWTNHFASGVLLACLVWLGHQFFLLEPGRKRRWILKSTVFIAVGYLPLIVMTLRLAKAGAMTRIYLRPFSAGEVYKFVLNYLSHGNSIRTQWPYESFQSFLSMHWAYLLVDLFFLSVLCWGMVQAWRKWKVEGHLCLYYFGVPILALFGASFFYRYVYIERSMIIVLPPFMILLALGVFSVPKAKLRAVAVGLLLTLNAVALANYLYFKSDKWTVYKPNGDWRSFSQDVAPFIKNTVVFVNAIPLPLKYYLPDDIAHVKVFLPSASLDLVSIRKFISYIMNERGLGDSKQFVYLVDMFWNEDRGLAFVNEQLMKTFKLIEKKTYQGLEAYRFALE